MNGLMMQQPLLISSLLVHAERHHGEQEVVSRRVEGDIHRTTYKELAARSRRMAKALAELGVKPGQTVATLAWNGYRHMELYYARVGHRRGAAHAEPAAAPRPGGLHRRPCRGPGAVLRPDLPAADRGRGRAREDDQALRRHDRPRAHAGEQQGAEPAVLRGTDRGAGRPVRLAAVRREQRQLAVLHLGHHRQPEGRAVQPPLDHAAHAGRRPRPTR